MFFNGSCTVNLKMFSCIAAVFLALAGSRVGSARADDWPQWQGPDRNAMSKEKGLLQEWPSEGPPLAWRVGKMGGGFSSPSVAGGRIFGMSYRGADEVVWALSEKDGKPLWTTKIGPSEKIAAAGFGGEGPRCTPTVDGDLLYALGPTGRFACLRVSDGKIVWRKNLIDDFHGRSMSMWHYAESPLVDGEKVICTPGGKFATIVALDKKTGELIWKSQIAEGNGASYASPIVIEAAGHRQYVHVLENSTVGIDATNGKLLWRSTKGTNHIANCTTPIFSDGYVFTASAYGGGGALVKLSSEAGGGVKAELVNTTKKMENHHGGVVLDDGYLYGANGGNGGGYLACLEFKTLKVQWTERKAPKASIALADGRLYYRLEDGPMLLIEPSPKGYIERGRFDQPDRSQSMAWAHPVIANGKLYLLDQDNLFCYDVRAK